MCVPNPFHSALARGFRVCFFVCGLLLAITASFDANAQVLHRTRTPSVPPVDEITVIAPGTTSVDKPQPIVVGDQVDIPPTIIVHNVYYTGDRDFRGPVFPGGPSIVVVEHPYTGERLYLDVILLPGSPRVVYRRDYIDYHFAKKRIRIQFKNLLDPLHPHAPVVKYCAANEKLRAGTSNEPRHSVAWLRRTGVPEAVKGAATGTKSLLDRSADGIKCTGEIVTRPIKLIARSTIIGSLFKEPVEAAAMRIRDAGNQRTELEGIERDRFIPTLR